MGASTWACGCGRRVPLSVDTCRCGAARPDDAAFSAITSSPAAPSATVPEEEARRVPRWVTQLGTVLLAVGVYFGSRGCNRWQASREARAAAIEGLSQVGVASPAGFIDRHHAVCFDETYQTGWGRRQSAKFDEEKYVRCLIAAIEKDGRTAVRPVSPPARVPVVTGRPIYVPPPTTLPTPEPDYGRITVGDFRLKQFKSQPNVQLVFTFVALGPPEAINHRGSCSVDVQCGGQRLPGYNEPTLTDCPLELQGSAWKGSKAISWANTTPVQGDCTLRFAFVRASRLRSNELVVDLKETPGP